ncbi:hypothetical protein [Psychrobacillus sp. L4]|uniref:hypothetical protein n=1 Tax=Psychrobacillus sp. L4 TaxID=3236892 RepID=UPI0036F284E3
MRKRNYIGFGLIFALGTIFYLEGRETGDIEATKNVVLESEIVKTSGIRGELQVYSFEEAVNKADLIAEIEIVKYLEDIKEPSPKTLFDAKIINTFSGNTSLRNIEILQQGNKEYSFNENPLFKKGEKYILFLKKAVGDRFDGTDTYWLLGEETNIYSVINNKIIKKWALWDEELTSIEIEENNSNKNSQLLDKNLFEEKMKKVINELK